MSGFPIKTLLFGLVSLFSFNSLSGTNSLPMNTEIKDIYQVVNKYLESKLSEDETYTLIENRRGSTYIDGVLVPNKRTSDVSKDKVLSEVHDRFRYEGDTLYTKCSARVVNSYTRIKCTDYRPRYKSVRMEGQPYHSIGDAVFDISNSLYNAFTPDTMKGGHIAIKVNNRSGKIKSIELTD